MSDQSGFDLKDFMPYLLNQAADVTSRRFEVCYKSRYGMLRTEWRVVFHLGRYGDMTASDICARARIHKTKVSRAIRALEVKRYLGRTERAHDRRQETLSLTPTGRQVFDDLYREAARFDAQMMAHFDAADQAVLRRLLTRIAEL
ncbi:MarR family winged helix-turn-helix transcriptional regulator [Jannaschia pohangensis]|uniref:Transcriptional regulator, MarR family n=1 Tax=Jannaschia pohangensis TaxID=390807 RepID=A0A1I3HGH4_9RHOB|nr:MarR family winged helix-turn-helix transcriptional regulator [Jannaschia pohangensis]SFI34855.1 transcriptional regulator, MarR family [Jannaschia pohangensis]